VSRRSSRILQPASTISRRSGSSEKPSFSRLRQTDRDRRSGEELSPPCVDYRLATRISRSSSRASPTISAAWQTAHSRTSPPLASDKIEIVAMPVIVRLPLNHAVQLRRIRRTFHLRSTLAKTSRSSSRPCRSGSCVARNFSSRIPTVVGPVAEIDAAHAPCGQAVQVPERHRANSFLRKGCPRGICLTG